MKKVLYLTNIEVPYKIRMLNELAKHCDLTVLYERKQSSNRNNTWAKSEIIQFHTEYLSGINIGNESSFTFKIMKYIVAKYDFVIVSCYNSPVQSMAIFAMRLLHIPYIISVDGEVFISKNFKSKIKQLLLIGAKGYLAAGIKSAESLRAVVGNKEIEPYYFSSLTENELMHNAEKYKSTKRNETILVVGQYYDYKGMDIALKAARMDKSLYYKFVGMGKRTEQFIFEQKADELENVEIIPFFQKQELEGEYKKCAMVVLPSRQECWGLVINEAASYGTPIVSTWGSGAAVEYMADDYPQYLAEVGNAEALYRCIMELKNSNHLEYSQYLITKSKKYSIETSAKAHLKVCEIEGA